MLPIAQLHQARPKRTCRLDFDSVDFLDAVPKTVGMERLKRFDEVAVVVLSVAIGQIFSGIRSYSLNQALQ
jgi:hypothetical protein